MDADRDCLDDDRDDEEDGSEAADWVVSNSRGGSQRRDSTELSISQNLTSPPQKQALSSASVKS